MVSQKWRTNYTGRSMQSMLICDNPIMINLIISMTVIMINFFILMFRELQSGLFHNVDPKVNHKSLLIMIA